jgi:tetratricopeptide (TPR) repeat protein
MGYLTRLSAGVLLFSIGINCWAECGGLDEKISALLKDKKYAEAEQMAMAARNKSPDDIEANLWLAYVYMNQALPSEIIVDTQAMGFGAGETGTAELKKDDVEKYFKPGTGHNPVYGEKTEQAFKEIIAKWKSDKRAYFCLMNYYQQSKRHEDLIAFVPEIIAAFKSEGYGLVNNLLPYPARYAEDEDFGHAIQLYIELLKNFPESAPINSSYGAAKLKSGDLRGGIESFERAYLLDKKDPIILGNLGTSYLYAQDFGKSERYFQELIKADPEMTEPYFTLAILAMSESVKGSKKAWENYFKQNEKYPDDAQWVKLAGQISEAADKNMDDESLYRLAITFNQGNASKYAIPLLVSLDKKYPNDIYYLFGLAQAYEYAGLPEEAYGYVHRAAAFANQPDAKDKTGIASFNYEAGRLACVLEKNDECLAFLKITEQHDVNFQNLQYMLGLANDRLGNTKEAIRQYELCVRKDNNKSYLGYCKSNYSRLTKPAKERI